MQRRPRVEHYQEGHLTGQHRDDEAPTYSGGLHIENSPFVTQRDVSGNGARTVDVS